MNKVFGARKLNMTYDISEFLKSFISEFIAEAIARIGIVVLDQATRVMRDASKQEGELTGQGARFAFSSHILTTIGNSYRKWR